MTLATPDTRIAIIGSGFAGLGIAIRLKQAGIDDFVILERADDLGGTWRDNTYPGCRCDVPSHLYSFSFAVNPDWSETYSAQPEIWDYLRRVAKEYDVLPHIRYGEDVQSARWDEREQLWCLKSTGGELTAQICVSAVGALADPRLPDIERMSEFEGEAFHSAAWNNDFDLTGKRVAVVGTGASAIQIVPRIQPRVERLYLCQRTPAWVLPHTNRRITKLERWLYRTLPPAQRLNRTQIYWGREWLVLGLAHNTNVLKPIQFLARRQIERQVRDPELRSKLMPNFTIGCKRIMLANDYYPALTKPNTEVLTGGVKELRKKSLVMADGTEREIDAIVFATGFHVTDMPIGSRVRGVGGRTLDDVWQGSPRAYLGSTVSGFPNGFFLLGPNTGLGHTSVVFMIEAQIDYVLQCIAAMDRNGWRTIDVRPEVEEAYNEEVQRKMKGTVWTAGGCHSWYLDGNGRNSTLWPRSTWRFRLQTRRFRPEEYAVRPLQPAADLEQTSASPAAR
ncbi:MAG: NAD(P)-binding protein [Propionibacteriales bacterium]|nr:NAD(P)-binding protein [Propionibacteriales bacterium]